MKSIQRLLQLSNYYSGIEAIIQIEALIKNTYSDINIENEFKSYMLYDILLHIHPTTIIYFEAYHHNHIDLVITYLVVDRLIYKKKTASKRDIHEISFYAQNIFDEERSENYYHAVNIALKVYSSKDWKTPHGFYEAFPEYLHTLKSEVTS